MKKEIISILFIICIVSCNNSGSTSDTPSSDTYSTSSSYVTCRMCNGTGQVYNDLMEYFETCPACYGQGQIQETSSQPSFTGRGGCTDCSCQKFQGTINDKYCTRCGHPWGRHK